MKRILLVQLFCLLAMAALGQGYIGPSPNATAVMRQANVGVNHYTGTPNISIPLAELSGRELGVSASLGYNSAANKVQDIASSEGLGWSLSAGGLITRVVRGEPDDLANGFCTPDRSDPEPDLFVFAFMGRSGKFVLDRSGKPVLFPFQDLDISPGICGGIIWEITDENGTRYQFGVSDTSKETTAYRPANHSEPAKNYVSTWHLSKVISANGTDEMNLSYTSSTVKYINYFFQKDDGCTSDTGLKDLSKELTINTKYLSSISSSGGSMYVTWNDNREDITGGKSLSGIRVINSLGEEIKKLRFEYSYFQSCSTQLCKRLKLEGIYDLSPDPIYSFTYNTNTNLPSRDSKSFDHWGYYNGYSGTSWIPADPVTGLAGASREPHITRMQANLLIRVNQRGGGYQHLYYEPHQGIRDNQNNVHLVSGVRINSIDVNDGMGNTITKYYKYLSSENSSISSGLLFRLPKYAAHIINDNNVVVVMRRYSHSYMELLDVNGTHLGYSRVEERITGKGKTIYNFTNYDDHPDEVSGNNGGGFDSPPYASSTSKFWERGNLDTVKVLDEQGKMISREWLEYTYNHPDKAVVTGTKSLSVSYNNCYGSSGTQSISSNYGIISRPFTLKKKTTELYDQEDPNNLRKITQIEEYGYDAMTYQLTTNTSYNPAVPNEKYLTVNKYVTHPDYRYSNSLTCLDQYNQCRTACGVRNGPCVDGCYDAYLYCLSNSVTDERVLAIQMLRAQHSHNTLVEQQSWLERGSTTPSVLLGATLHLYKRIGAGNSKVVPASAWAGEKTGGTYSGSSINSAGQFVQPASFRQVHTYDTYNQTNSRLTKETARDGIETGYSWLHNWTLPDTVTVNPGTTGAQMSSYKYKPSVGVIKETDTNGRSTNTEYDHQGRVRLVKDHEGMIRERYRYHYKDESPNLTVRASVTQAKTGQGILFFLEDIVHPGGGTPKFVWDMGNGTVYDDNRQSFNFSYTAVGLYTVKLVMFTNESAPVTRTLQIQVTAP
jgi:hypothetical protein